MTGKTTKIIIALLLVLAFSVPIFAVDSEETTTPIFQEVFSSPDYLVTTGDVYTLTYNALNTVVKYTIIVDPTYKVKVSNLGIIDAKGKTFFELKKEVEDIVSSNYPMSAVQLVLSSPSTFKITVAGEVGTVHETRVSGLVRVSSVVSANATNLSSRRFVTVEDADGNINRYDLFLAQRFGDMSQDPYVRPNDIITLEKAQRRVSITGAVERPGTYELLEGENLTKLIDYYASGFGELADRENITLSRNLSSFAKSGETIYLNERAYRSNLALLNLDSVYVGSKADLQKTMFVQGAIESSGATANAMLTQNAAFRFEEGESYAHFARTHRGLFSDAADYGNAYVYRDGQSIAIDLYSMVFDPEYDSSLKLRANDILVVPFKQFFVTVAGAVGAPGRYPYIPDRKWDYYMTLAGGYDTSVNNPDTIEITTLEGKSLSTDDFILPETTITAPSMLRIIIGGEVTRHQEITLRSSLTRLSSVVSSYRTPYSSERFVTVKDKNGNVKHFDFFLMSRFGDLTQDPYVKDGDTITIERADRKVTISGSVERPGTYELKKGENLKTLIQYYAGGLDPLADTSNIMLTRLISGNDKAGEVLYLDQSALSNDYVLVNRDSVSIGTNRNLRNTIFIQGAVDVQIDETVRGNAATNNIRYQFESGETYLKFVRNHKNWFTDVSDYNRTYISRNGEKLPIDLYSMLFKPEYVDDLKLEADDILVVPFRQFFVTVSGAVKVPGRYAYVPDRTWDYYIGLAGGFDPDLNAGDKISMTTAEGKKLKKAEYVLPETTIDAARNSFTYNLNKYATPIATILSLITSSILLYNYFSQL